MRSRSSLVFPFPSALLSNTDRLWIRVLQKGHGSDGHEAPSNELMIIIRKQVQNLSPMYKRIGVIGSVALIKTLTSQNGSPFSSSLFSSPLFSNSHVLISCSQITRPRKHSTSSTLSSPTLNALSSVSLFLSRSHLMSSRKTDTKRRCERAANPFFWTS